MSGNTVVLIGSWVETGDVLVGKLTPQEAEETLRAPEGKLLEDIFGIQVATSKETYFKVPPEEEAELLIFVSLQTNSLKT